MSILAERIGADGPRAAHLRAELREHERGAAGRARGGHLDLLDELAALAFGDRLDRAHEHVEHVDAHRDRLHEARSAGWTSP